MHVFTTEMKTVTETQPVEDHYMLSRGFAANIRFVLEYLAGSGNNSRTTRLNLQHYLWKDEVGYLLHPSIPLDVEDLSVADIGVGTG